MMILADNKLEILRLDFTLEMKMALQSGWEIWVAEIDDEILSVAIWLIPGQEREPPTSVSY